MKCPHCKYIPDVNEYDWVENPGHFYEFPLEMRQKQNDFQEDDEVRRTLVGCPKCGVVFMDVGDFS